MLRFRVHLADGSSELVDANNTQHYQDGSVLFKETTFHQAAITNPRGERETTVEHRIVKCFAAGRWVSYETEDDGSGEQRPPVELALHANGQEVRA